MNAREFKPTVSELVNNSKLIPKHLLGSSIVKLMGKIATNKETLKGFGKLGVGSFVGIPWIVKFNNMRENHWQDPDKEKELDKRLAKIKSRLANRRERPEVKRKSIQRSKNFDILHVINNLWKMENASNEGYDEKTGKYYIYTTKNGNHDIGPGLDTDKHPELKEWASKGRTKEELNSKATEILKLGIPAVNLNLGKYSNRVDTISPLIKEGMLDMYYQVGDSGLALYDKLPKAVAEGNMPMIRKESKTYFTPGKGAVISPDRETIVEDGITKVLDDRRWNNRNDTYFYYKYGGRLISKNIDD